MIESNKGPDTTLPRRVLIGFAAGHSCWDTDEHGRTRVSFIVQYRSADEADETDETDETHQKTIGHIGSIG